MNELRKMSKRCNLRSQTDQYVSLKVDDVLIIDLVLVVVCLVLKKLNILPLCLVVPLDHAYISYSTTVFASRVFVFI